ncbi:MAG: redoxin domain-containing protein [bacterium]
MKIPESNQVTVKEVFERIRSHDFHPLNDDNSMTMDRNLNVAGIADLDDDDWRVRLLAVRDLVRKGISGTKPLIDGLADQSVHVRQITAMALGILRSDQAVEHLEFVFQNDSNTMVRSQAAVALGQIGSKSSRDLLRERLQEDPSRDVRHQIELSIDQIEKNKGATEKLLNAYLTLDETEFGSISEGEPAPDFILEDTEGKKWQLSQLQNQDWVVLIWVFADWCPVCHGEFHELIEMKEDFKKADVQVFTIEIHDTYRGRVMVGKELEPEYWFAKEPFIDAYTRQIWWTHLLDRAGAVAARYGADPLAFAVHAEYINRPATIIIDPEGIIRFAYTGTFWGDRPTIKETLKMVETGEFSFEHPQRRKNGSKKQVTGYDK